MERARISRAREYILSGSLPRVILWLAAPLVVSSSIESLYQVVDTFWLSRLGSAALGVPSVSWPYRAILWALGMGIAATSAGITGQYVGAGDHRKAARVIGATLGMLMAIGIPLSFIFTMYASTYMQKANVPEDIYNLALSYIALITMSTPLSYVFMVFNFSMGSVGDTRTPMKVSIMATALNTVLDPLLIFYANMGVLGAALATVLAAAASAGYAAYSLATGRHGVKLELRDLVPDKNLALLILRASAPMAAQRIAVTLGFTMMVPIVAGLGTEVVAAYSIGQVVLSLSHVVSFPLIRATGIVVSQNLGAMQERRAKRAVLVGLLMLLAAESLYIAFLLAAREQFIRLFSSDPSVLGPASRMLLIFGPSVAGFSLLMLADSVARASGHTTFMSAVGIARLWLLRIPLSWLFAYYLAMGDRGLWLGMAMSNYVGGTIGLLWLRLANWARPIIESAGRIDRSNKL
ncbi:MAG: MATE family efflux transporter [Thermoproteota archaeon]